MGPARLPSVATSLADVIAALERAGEVHDDPDDRGSVTVLDHALQAAAIVAEVYPDDLELQAAALVHDLGLVLDPDDWADHARRGAHFVGVVLGSRVAEIVALHVDALRYLITAVPGYVDRLGRESEHTLALAGQPLEAKELEAFLAAKHWRAAVALRRADELSRSPGVAIGTVDRWWPVLAAVSLHAGFASPEVTTQPVAS